MIKAGTVKQINGELMRMQADGNWQIANTEADTWAFDLQSAETSDILNSMANTPTSKKKKEASLIPGAETYINAGLNLLLIGPHGTGKTASIMQIADNLGLKMKYFSCSTLDPYTDLIGIPTPRILCSEHGQFETKAEHHAMHPECKVEVVEFLKNVRPHDLDEAEFLFFDEFNRADPKTLNALFEIIQFKTLNGEPLPNLKVCWAAMNPPDEDYEVEKVDPALLDRFDLYVPISAKPSVSYMESKGIPKYIASALQAWWNEHERAISNGTKDNRVDYISPRRLEKIGHVWVATGGDVRAIKMALPVGADLDVQKLLNMLRQAQQKTDADAGIVKDPAVEENTEQAWDGAGIGDQPNPNFTYTIANISLEKAEIAEWLSQNPNHLPTHQAVSDALRMTIGGEELVKRLPQVLNAMNPSVLEGLVSAFPSSKVRMMCSGFKNLYNDDPVTASELTNLHKILKASGSGGSDFPTL